MDAVDRLWKEMKSLSPAELAELRKRMDHSNSVSEPPSHYGPASEGSIQLQIERLPEGVYLATSEDVPGLVAQGRTISETLEIARDLAKKLLEEQQPTPTSLRSLGDRFDYPLVIGW